MFSTLDPAFSTRPRVFHQTPRFLPDPAFSTRPRVFHRTPRFPPDPAFSTPWDPVPRDPAPRPRVFHLTLGFSLGLSNHKSSSTNRVEEKSKSGNRSTCWAHFCGLALKLRQGTYQIEYTWYQTWLTFEVHREYIFLVFALNTL